MLINNLQLKNFRNINSCTLDVSHKNIILKGENGQGKTNLLESLYLLCFGSSFRTPNLKEAIKYGSGFFYLKSEFEDSQSFFRSTEISFDGDKKTIKVDGKEIHDRKELIYNLPCIVFSHDDIEFVRGEPENRRKFFDQTMTMYDPVFFDELRRYKQVLRQRNAALKEQRYSLLDVYDQKLSHLGIPLMKAREKICSSFAGIFPEIYEKVSLDDRKINISYRPSWSLDFDEEQIIKKLAEQRDTDIKMSTTTSGPHRDRFVITDKNGIFVNGASTGQMRLASLVFRSAQARFFREKSSEDPIFLMDDVLLELDGEKRSRYLSCLGNYSQAFFTFLPEEKYFGQSFDISGNDSKVYTVKEGTFTDEGK